MTASPCSRPRRCGVAVAAVIACLAAALTQLGVAPGARAESGATLHLVTLDGAGTSTVANPVAARAVAVRMREVQDAVLETADVGEPVYRWTTALNGFAVELDEEQVAALSADPRVARVEKNEIRPLASVSGASSRTTPAAAARARQRGAGVVVGVVDSGIDPDSAALSPVTPLGPVPADFRGTCDDAPEDDTWNSGDCDSKVVAAQHYVAGFGEDRLRANAALSPADTDGHGTAVASVAAGASGVTVDDGEHRLGRFSGVAPRARVAAYKACWSAPDPEDDGCATADLVAAIDRATADRVDVLNLSVGGLGTIDTVERALLGAAEGGAVVVAAAGNQGGDQFSAHPSPWVLTVGATTGAEPVGVVEAEGGPALQGAMASSRSVGPAPLVLAEDVAAPGAALADARVCAPRSLDAARVAGAVVVCERGRVARLQKSAAVELADGAGMVLTNTRAGSTDADLHPLPTVHLAARDADRLLRWARSTERPRVSLSAVGLDDRPARAARFSSAGDPASHVLKPDLVAVGVGVPAPMPDGWELVSGTSIAAARVAGHAAVLLGRRDATPEIVRSALVTTAHAVPGESALHVGAGTSSLHRTPSVAVTVPVEDYRAWLTGDRTEVNQPHLLLSNGQLRGRRTLTNAGRRPVTVTATVEGFRGAVEVTPAVVTIGPGRSRTFTVRATGHHRQTDDGAVVWRTPTGRSTRVVVVVTR